MAGFVTGEGTFFVKINKGRNRAGIGVQLVFQVAQQTRDIELPPPPLLRSMLGGVPFWGN